MIPGMPVLLMVYVSLFESTASRLLGIASPCWCFGQSPLLAMLFLFFFLSCNFVATELVLVPIVYLVLLYH